MSRSDTEQTGSFDDLPDYVIIELWGTSDVTYTKNKFTNASKATELHTSLNRVLERYPRSTLHPHFQDGTQLQEEGGGPRGAPPEPTAGPEDTATPTRLGDYVQVRPAPNVDVHALATELADHPAVKRAYVAPRPEPQPGSMMEFPPAGSSKASRNFQPCQGYLGSAPNGSGVLAVAHKPGALGDGVGICDIGFDWNLRHEGLPENIPLIGGTIEPAQLNRDHGTAVLGVWVGQPRRSGIVGICPKAQAMVQSAIIDAVYNPAGAILNAARNLRPGDVLCIQLQVTGPQDKFVAIQFLPDAFRAIQWATQKGVVVIEPSGNGDANFDDPIYQHTGLQRDAGAVMVGAGVPPMNFFDIFGSSIQDSPIRFGPFESIGVPRSRIWFSSYGHLLDVQAWGWFVTSMGYGDAQGGPEHRWYTLRFGGTSSAAAIVAGVAAGLQGVAIAKTGSPLEPSRLRSLLIETGTPQTFDPKDPERKHIGPLPDMVRALRKL